MRRKFIAGLVPLLFLFVILALVPLACDIAKPQKKFRLAVPTTEYFYNYIAGHLKPFLERQGYEISIVPAADVIDANRMVAEGEADLTMVNNHSTTVALVLGKESDQLRAIMPLTTRLLFVYTKEKMRDSATVLEVFKDKRVGIEFLGGETHLTLNRFMGVSRIDGVKFEAYSDSADVNVFWGSYYGDRSAEWDAKGWHPYRFRSNFIEFVMLHDQAIRPIKLPALPGNPNSVIINTLATEVILVANKSLGENACYLLALAIFQNKVELLRRDMMFSSIKENFDKERLLYPVHQGTFSYLVRDQPTFFERYAESLALVISFIAIIYGAIQAVQSRLRRNKKERIDKYFLEFLEIRSDKASSRDERIRKLDELFQRAVVQLTNEKLDKADFHILSRLIQQDLTMSRFN